LRFVAALHKKEKDAEAPDAKDLSVIDEYTESEDEVEKFERANLSDEVLEKP